jgi:hypothetical protein
MVAERDEVVVEIRIHRCVSPMEAGPGTGAPGPGRIANLGAGPTSRTCGTRACAFPSGR